MNYERLNWENGTEVEGAYVEINGTRYPVVMPEYIGNTPVDATNLNVMDKGIDDASKNITIANNNINLITKYLNLNGQRLWSGNAKEGAEISITNAKLYSAYIVRVVINGGSSIDATPIICGRVGQGAYISDDATLNATSTSFNTYSFIAENLGTISGTNNERWYIAGVGHMQHNASGNHGSINKTDKIIEVIGLSPYSYNSIKNLL